MTEPNWRAGRPPHQMMVEVEYEGRVLQGRAVWGNPDTGVLPHWELDNGLHVEPMGISRWRYLTDGNPITHNEGMRDLLNVFAVPDYLHDGLLRYVLERIPTGSFLRAVLENDLADACSRAADPLTAISLHRIIAWLRVAAPEECWGSRERVAAWLLIKEPKL